MMFFYVWLALVFVLGAIIGSFLNVCITRLPLEKSLLWPPTSRCGHCLQPVRGWDNIPLLSWWILRGRCRTCGARFSFKYFLVELVTGLGFAWLLHLIVVDNVHHLEVIRLGAWRVGWGWIPYEAWVIFAHHAVLFSFLMIVGWCDWNRLEIPLSVTLTGTFIGLALGTIWPWPWPNAPVVPYQVFARSSFWVSALYHAPPLGSLQPWPFWWPLPEWFADGGNWQTGLANGMAGMLAGTILLRGIRFIFSVGRGIEGLGLGDADLMMMAGAFLGWQPVVFALFLGVFFALPLGIIKWLITKDQAIPFGPALALAVLFTGLSWTALAPDVHYFFFHRDLMLATCGGGALFLFIAAVTFRLLRGRPVNEPPPETKEQEKPEPAKAEKT